MHDQSKISQSIWYIVKGRVFIKTGEGIVNDGSLLSNHSGSLTWHLNNLEPNYSIE